MGGWPRFPFRRVRLPRLGILSRGFRCLPCFGVPILRVDEVSLMSVSGSSRLISLQEAGDYYGVSVKTVRRWIAAGRLEGYRVGPRLLRVRVESLDSATRRLATA